MTTPENVGEDFADWVEVDSTSGCWIWFGSVTEKGRYPIFSRRAAWRFAHEMLHGPVRKNGNYPVIQGCVGRECVNPDHRIGVPRDHKGTAHRCTQCQEWHYPPGAEAPVSSSVTPEAPPTHKASPRTKKFTVTPRGLQETTTDDDLTPEQQALEDMMDDSQIGQV